MRFGRRSTGDEDGGLPIRLPFMKRSRQPTQETKENIPPEDGEMHDSAFSSPKASRRRTVIGLFKHKGAVHKEDEDNDNILTRMTAHRNKSRKHRRSESSYTVSDGILDRILGPSKEQEKKRASDNFFVQQQIRADSRNASASNAPPSFDVPSGDEPNRVLTEEEIFLMFEGAPCFSVSNGNKGYRSQVVFHGGSTGLPPDYTPDYKQFDHESFSASTLGVPTVRESDEIPFTSHLRVESKKTGAGDTLLEVPDMTSATGVEPGTVGFEYFLQLPIAESLAVPDEPETFEKRHLLTSNPTELGLRAFDLAQLVDNLTDAGNLYNHLTNKDATTNLLEQDKIDELGEKLFSGLLSADAVAIPDEDGQHYSLESQIDALSKVLHTRGLWHNFSLVEWRIRVGQLLWTDVDVDDQNTENAGHLTERDVFLLQVTLAAELLVRLKLSEAVSELGTSSTDEIATTDRTAKVKWDLLLAERFLTNLSVSALSNAKEAESGIRNSFFSAISFFTTDSDPQSQTTKPILRPRNEDKQIAGLLAFAGALNWAHTDDVHAQLRPGLDHAGNERPVSMVSIYATPLNSPRLFNMENAPGTRTSYFGTAARQQQNRPGFSRMSTTQSIQLRPASEKPDGFSVGGWLSRSWLSGLVLPGEAASHFLISTLLENSPQAIDALGDNADLYGGFVYQGRTFWSKTSAVGRVLAATSGAVECMGWISVPGAPAQHPDGWVNAKITDYPYPSTQPRIKDHEALAKSSDPFHNADASQLRAADFTSPTDSPPVMGNEVLSHGLSFVSPDDSSSSTSSTSTTNAKTTAQITFSSPINPKLPRLSVPLTYDVHFISSYPCYPVPTTETASSIASSPSDHNNALSLHTTSTLDKPPPPAHPLHISYSYMTLPVATLLSAGAEEARSRALSLPDEKAEAESGDVEEEVAVLDCRGSADLELLARAWCAKVGENAVVGKVEEVKRKVACF
ncbi:hypothetical protein Q7P37_011261 [Cladosporium fusiforme]